MIASIVQQLSSGVSALRTVKSTADMALVLGGRLRHALPAAFVHPVRDTAGEPQSFPAHTQIIRRQVGVLLLVAAQGADRGAGSHDVLEPLFDAVRTTLAGWTPSGADEPLRLVSGEMVRVADGVAWWLELFETAELLRT